MPDPAVNPQPFPASTRPDLCTPRSARAKGGRTLSLPVVEVTHGGSRNAWSGGHPTIAHSKVGKWRAIVLIVVHVAIAIHIVQWLVTGLTLSPVEPSESMQTLRDGVVNAGFVFFVAAILSTALFGRFFCGWLCHIVALQDLCLWAMLRLGVKPKPFRSRLLLWVPLGLALYMFVWPVFLRSVLRPLLADQRGRLPSWLGQIDPIPGLRSEFLITDFWSTFAPWYIAIPFLAVVGFATVYVLGAKGFCAYGCPYGGFFGPVDLAAVGKIKVNDDCHQCGHCTAVCTSNVRVHEEVRDYGVVVDPGCMKCLDCISVCPNDALSFGFARPTLLTKPKRGQEGAAAKAKALREARYDLSWPEELVCAGLFLSLFLAFRGMFNQVPMLMAVAMAGIGTWMAWKTWSLLRVPNSRFHGFQLKYRGRLRPAGAGLALLTLATVALAAWSGYVRAETYAAQLAYQRLETPLDVVLRPDFEPTPAELDAARRSLAHYQRASSPRDADSHAPGGVGWRLAPPDWVNITYLRLLTGDRAGAEAALQRVLAAGHPRDDLVSQLAALMAARGAKSADIEAMYERAVTKHDDLFVIHDRLARRDAGNAATKPRAVERWEGVLARHPHSAVAPLTAAAFFRDVGDAPRALSLVDRALESHTITPGQRVQAAGLLASLGQPDRAAALAAEAATLAKKDSGPRMAGALLLAQIGRPDDALRAADEAVRLSRERGRYAGQASALLNAGLLNIELGRRDAGLALVRDAAAAVEGSPWDLARMGATLVSTGERHNDRGLIEEGAKLLEKARDLAPSAPTLRRDLAMAYGRLGRDADAEAQLRAAAETLAPANPDTARLYAMFLQAHGRGAESQAWLAKAEERARARAARP
jgi:polyferredoxin/tetratricopeptide (TPR) repeat protein